MAVQYVKHYLTIGSVSKYGIDGLQRCVHTATENVDRVAILSLEQKCTHSSDPAPPEHQ